LDKQDAVFKLSEFYLNNERNEKAYFLFALEPGAKVSFKPKENPIIKSNKEKYIIYSLLLIILIMLYYIYKIKY